MAEITKKNLVLGFKTTAGKEMKLTIKAPAEGLEASTISSVMDEIIDTNALGEETQVSTKDGAKYIIQQEESITL